MSTPASSTQKRTKTERVTVRMRNELTGKEKTVNKDKKRAEHNVRELCKMLTHRP